MARRQLFVNLEHKRRVRLREKWHFKNSRTPYSTVFYRTVPVSQPRQANCRRERINVLCHLRSECGNRLSMNRGRRREYRWFDQYHVMAPFTISRVARGACGY